MNLPEQISSKFVIETSGCWIWQRSIAGGGYGYINWKRKTQKAMRLIYEMLVGPIPPGLQLDHKCHNPLICPGGKNCPHRPCVNPYHMKPVTNRENSRRTAKAMKAHCIRGHERNEANTLTRKDGRKMCRVCNRERMRKNEDFSALPRRQ